jgi:hypothetical protein
MSYNGTGTFLINTAGQPVVASTVISATTFNLLTADLANGLTNVITKDGQTTVTANIPMSNFKITGLGAATTANDAVRLEQLTSGATNVSFGNLAYTGTLTGGTGVIAIGTNQIYKDASGNVGIGTSSPASKLSFGTQFIGNNGYANAIRVYDDGSVSASQTSNSYGIGFVNNVELAHTAGDGGLHTWYTANTKRMQIESSGIVRIANTNTSLWVGSEKLAVLGFSLFKNAGTPALVWNTDATGGLISFSVANRVDVGSITSNGTTTAYNTTSDYRLKENVAPMQNALATVAQLKPCTYTWKSNGSDGQGFIAHELQAVVPDCVTGEKDGMRTVQYEISPAIPAVLGEDGEIIEAAVEAVMGERQVPQYQGIDVSFLVATLTAAIQEQQALIQDLTTRLNTLEGN